MRVTLWLVALAWLLGVTLTVSAGGPPGSEGTVESADGVSIHYVVAGDGPVAVVMIHGWSCDSSSWDRQVADLARTWRVVRVDLAGHGASGANRTTWSMAAFAQDVRAVVETLGLDRVVLVGHSMGGPVALEAARLMPGRVLAVVGVDTLHDVEQEPSSEQVGAWIGEMERDFAGYVRDRFVPSLFPPDADPELVRRVAEEIASAPPEVALAAVREAMAFDRKTAVEGVPVPLVCINSAMHPTNVEGNRRHAAAYEAVIMDGVGHFPMLERPAEFNRVLADVVTRVAGPREVPMRAIVKQVEVEASRAEVWRVWTTSTGAQEFFAPRAHISLEPLGPYEIFFLPDAPPGSRGADGMRVLSYLPMEMLSFEWNFPPSIPSLRGSDARTWVVLRFEDGEGGTTRVRMTHLGWREGEDWDRGFAYFDKAWDVVLGRLEQRFESGPVDWSRP